MVFSETNDVEPPRGPGSSGFFLHPRGSSSPSTGKFKERDGKSAMETREIEALEREPPTKVLIVCVCVCVCVHARIGGVRQKTKAGENQP